MSAACVQEATSLFLKQYFKKVARMDATATADAKTPPESSKVKAALAKQMPRIRILIVVVFFIVILALLAKSKRGRPKPDSKRDDDDDGLDEELDAIAKDMATMRASWEAARGRGDQVTMLRYQDRVQATGHAVQRVCRAANRTKHNAQFARLSQFE